MSKEELLKIQTCTLKVDIHCDGCKRKVKKILEKIEGVYKVVVDSEHGKVMVSGNVDPPTLVKKLEKCGKPAQVWGDPKENQPMNNKEKVDNKNQGQTPQHELQQLKGFQDLKFLPQFQDMKLPSVGGGVDEKGGQKSVKFKVPEIDESDDDDYEDEEEEDEFDDDDDIIPMKKPVTTGMNNILMKGGQMMKEVGNDGQKGGGEGQNKSGHINIVVPSGTAAGFQPMMNQQRANDNERFQPMMYARPPPDVTYMRPTYPYPQGDLFSDDNTSSCNLM